MMATPAALKASEILTADSPRGQEAVAVFRAQYNKVGLNPERGQILIGNKDFSIKLRKLIEECSMPIKVPDGGRVHVVYVPVDPARDWQGVINAIDPTKPRDDDVRKIGGQYPVQSGRPKEREIFLINFGKTVPNGEYALEWAKSRNLRPATPREVFAIGEFRPNLNHELDIRHMAVVSPDDRIFKGRRRACYVMWYGEVREVVLGLFDREWYARQWFAFVRE